MADTKRQKAKSVGFAGLGIPVGSTLTYRRDENITCKTVDEKNKVSYDGKESTISKLAKELMKTPISGYHAFKYNGVILAKMASSTEGSEEPAVEETSRANTAPVVPSTPEKPAQNATEAPRTASVQPMPLPSEEDPLMSDNLEI